MRLVDLVAVKQSTQRRPGSLGALKNTSWKRPFSLRTPERTFCKQPERKTYSFPLLRLLVLIVKVSAEQSRAGARDRTQPRIPADRAQDGADGCAACPTG